MYEKWPKLDTFEKNQAKMDQTHLFDAINELLVLVLTFSKNFQILDWLANESQEPFWHLIFRKNTIFDNFISLNGIKIVLPHI